MTSQQSQPARSSILVYDFQDRIRTLQNFDAAENFDAVVIGSGAGGATAAYLLQAHGLRVLIVEEGDYFSARDYGDKSPLESIQTLYRNGGLTFTTGNTNILLPQGKCVGGTTVINSGTALRATPPAVRRWKEQWHLDEFAGSVDNYYDLVEKIVSVARSPRDILGNNTSIFEKGAGALGYAGEILPRFQHECRAAGRCAFGCPNDAKQAMNVSVVPNFLRRGGTILVSAQVKSIDCKNGEVVSVTVVGGGKEFQIKAKTYIIAAGAIYTPLLLRTVSGMKGIKPGKNLTMHPASRVIGVMPEPVHGEHDVPQSYHVTQFLEEGVSIEGIFLPKSFMGIALPFIGQRLVHLMGQYQNLAMIGYRIIEDSRGKILPRLLGYPRSWPIVWYSLEKVDVKRFQRATSLSARILFAAGAKSVFTSIYGFEELKNPGDCDRLEAANIAASEIESSAFHAQGTANMGTEPSNSVVDPNGKVWGLKNLFIADASVIPSTPVSNPQMTIMAFAFHVTKSILKESHSGFESIRV